ncbi:hypothetical protein MMC13_000855 [Lambiella insularis]|nr:hypothetical protein [Lambiella insularis]
MAYQPFAFSAYLVTLAFLHINPVRSLPQVTAALSTTLSLSSDSFTLIQPTSSGATQLPSSIQATKPGTIGSIPTSLETEGYLASQPFATATVTSPTTPYRTSGFIGTPASSASRPSGTANPQVNLIADNDVANIFQPIDTNPPPTQITSRGDHPVPTLGIVSQTSPISTNKFYANLFLGSQTNGVWTHPYSVSWSHGSGNVKSWGMSISQIDAYLRAYGPQDTAIPGSPVQYVINPIGIQSLVFSAIELGSDTVLTTDTVEAFSINANLQPQAGSTSRIQFPLVQGMGFVTAIYTNLQPAVQSGVFFKDVINSGSPRAGIFKYTATLADGNEWLIYAISSDGTDPGFVLTSNTLFQGPAGWSGTIQVAKNPAGASGETDFDQSAGVYATAGSVGGSVSGDIGTYQISWTKAGLSTGQPLLMFALPHHLSSFDSTTTAAATDISLTTTTKGNATAVLADSWTMIESALPVSMGFSPWRPSTGSQTEYSSSAVSAIMSAASSEVNQDMGAQSNLDSMYYAGKALSKFASIIYTINNIGNDPILAQQGLSNLKVAYALFATNSQIYPLVYDTVWGGVVSSASYSYQTGNSGADFGNTYYNDHHFHYGYFIHAAAIIGSLDSTWLAQNKNWVNALVRDVANPSLEDNYFPFSRSFDWYHGHSFAKGLFESGDSKDEESSSEDVMFAYAMKMWGQVVGDAAMEARGNLMLSVLARSLQHYFLYQSDNTVQPANFIANKVSGILFENKIDHTTYFGGNYEYTQGIHMVPLQPCSALSRTTQFVTEEWDTYFAEGAVAPASDITGGWKGILYANLALIDPQASFDFFSSGSFDPSCLDGGASQTWYLAFAAGEKFGADADGVELKLTCV